MILRNFVSALERPLAALWIGGSALVINALLVWTLMFGHFGLPALGLPGAGIATTITNIYMAVGLAVLITLDRRFRRYHLFGRFWRPDWSRFRAIWRIGLPIGVTLAFEVTIFNAATFLMGLISPAALAAHAIAIQIPSLTFMVPLGLGTAATVRVGRAYGARDIAGIARAGWSAYGMALVYACGTATLMLLFARELVGLFLDLNDPADAVVVGLAASFLVLAGIFQIVDGAQVVGVRHAARPRRHARADVLRRPRLLGHRPAARRRARVLGEARRHRHLDRPVDRPCGGRRADDRALDPARAPRPHAAHRAGRQPAALHVNVEAPAVTP